MASGERVVGLPFYALSTGRFFTDEKAWKQRSYLVVIKLQGLKPKMIHLRVSTLTRNSRHTAPDQTEQVIS